MTIESAIAPGERLRMHFLLPLALLVGWAYGATVHHTNHPQGTAGGRANWNGGVITGRVTREGLPQSGVHVLLFGEPGISCPTGADGSYRLSNVPEGKHLVMASLGNVAAHRWTDRWVAVAVGRSRPTATADLKLVQGATLIGKVVDPLGVPVTRGRVAVFRREQDGGMWGDFAATGSDGHFQMRLPAGKWLIEELPGFGNETPAFEVLAWDEVHVADGEAKHVTLREIKRRAGE